MTFAQSAYGFLPYVFDWTAWLSTDTIVSASVTATAPLVASAVSSTTKLVNVWIDSSECTPGDLIPVRCEIVTAGGMTESRTMHIAVVE